MKLAFAAIPAFGHVLPMVPLAEAATRAGHEVTFVADTKFAGRLPVPVLQGVPEGQTLADVTVEAKAAMLDRDDPMAWPKALFGVVMPRHTAPRLLAAWADDGPPDVVVHEALNVGAAKAAAETGIPAVAFHIGLAPAEMLLAMLAPMVGVPIGPVIDPVPPTCQRPGRSSLDRLPIRSVAWSDSTTTLPAWLSRGTGVTAYLTLGTVAFEAVDVLRRSVLETAERCERVLVAVGPEGDPAALGNLPAHVHVERYVDQAAVLGRVDVVIHHGGTGTVLGCLAAGVPQVITPQGADQFLNAERLAELDLGSVVDNDAEPGAVATAVERALTDPGLRARTDAVRSEIAAMPDPAEVVAVLERRLS
ncbi:glycosyltransferase [Nocardioides speluncae]|uniref:glycosyltransferase n=1 Tax=Nocardioides speluncae TaxID=2670337 RepID=UPI00137AEBB4|nr:glycosyltransferase [Nocardioides speluncae]